ncbi:nuclease-related domain-containing protein [Salsuginibacillus kocurii]|uniref:nuclease-related domain-containing protein n=1 Tax=Salsuginibacillus kocurii TaxID=427078 RepID=UPI0009FD49B6|nr:nuclease-related domain-containing protein [Salsuginibacillus kocurii]
MQLSGKPYNYQMDALLLTPTFTFHIEVKNYTGTLWFDDPFDQMIRTNEETEEGFRNPIHQVVRHREKLLPLIPGPLASCIVINRSSTILKSLNAKKRNTDIPIIHRHNLLHHFKALEEQFSSAPVFRKKNERRRYVSSLN